MPQYNVPIYEKHWGFMVFEAKDKADALRILESGDLDGDEEYYYNGLDVEFESDKLEEG